MSGLNVFVGSELGLLKGANLETKIWSNVNDVSESNRENSMDKMCWADDEETSIYLGFKSRKVCLYDTEQAEVVKTFPCDEGQGRFVGLGHLNKCPVTCTESGLVKVWSPDSPTQIQFAKELYTCRQNPNQRHLIAVGGKEYNLELRDLQNTDKVLFKAKNVKGDWLGLRVAVWVTDICFIPNSQQIAVSTGLHQLRLYDPTSSMRRPVIDFMWEEHPITAMNLVPNSMQVVVGNTQGSLAMLDFRRPGKFVRKYKGQGGAIRDIQCHAERPLVSSCGLDRHLRVHHLINQELVHKYYMKTPLNCLLFAKKWPAADKQDESMETEDKPEISKESDHDSSDEIWENLKKVKTKRSQRTKSKNNVTNTENTDSKLEETSASKLEETSASSGRLRSKKHKHETNGTKAVNKARRTSGKWVVQG